MKRGFYQRVADPRRVHFLGPAVRATSVAAVLAWACATTPATANQMWGVTGDNTQCTMTGPEFNVAIRWERGSPKLDVTFRSEAFVSLIGETHTFHWAFVWPDSDPVPPTWSEPSTVVNDRQDMTVPHQVGYRRGAIALKQPPEPFLTLLAKENVIQIYTDDAGDSLWLEGSGDGVQRFRQCMRRVGLVRNSQ